MFLTLLVVTFLVDVAVSTVVVVLFLNAAILVSKTTEVRSCGKGEDRQFFTAHRADIVMQT